MDSSAVPAVPCTSSVESPLMAAARCSLTQLFAVPGRPSNSNARSVANVATAISMRRRCPTYFGRDRDPAVGLAADEIGNYRPGGEFPAWGTLTRVFAGKRVELRRKLLLRGASLNRSWIRLASRQKFLFHGQTKIEECSVMTREHSSRAIAPPRALLPAVSRAARSQPARANPISRAFDAGMDIDSCPAGCAFRATQRPGESFRRSIQHRQPPAHSPTTGIAGGRKRRRAFGGWHPALPPVLRISASGSVCAAMKARSDCPYHWSSSRLRGTIHSRASVPD